MANPVDNPLLAQMLNGGGGLSQAAMADALLAQFPNMDAQTQMLARYLLENRQNEVEEAEEIDADFDDLARIEKGDLAEEEIDADFDDLAEDDTASEAFMEMEAELAELRERNDELAAALGCCYICFGEDEACPVCRGNGYPGAKQPDKMLFKRYVLPVIKKLQISNHKKAAANNGKRQAENFMIKQRRS